mgnify:CR=1 FL=1
MTLNTLEWVALVLLVLGGIKGLTGLIYPQFLINARKNLFLRNYNKWKSIWLTIILILSLFLLYLSFTSMTIAQFVVAGYAFYLFVMFLFFFKGNALKRAIEEWVKIPLSYWRLVLGLWFVITLVLIWFLLN